MFPWMFQERADEPQIVLDDRRQWCWEGHVYNKQMAAFLTMHCAYGRASLGQCLKDSRVLAL